MVHHPYYIISPKYTRTSGGVRTLFRLADNINKLGGDAFIFLWPYCNHELATSPMDVAPFLTKKIVDYHFEKGLTPIVIYPETIRVSRFNPTVRVRYLLNYNELFFQNEPLESDDYLLFYSKAIADQVAVKKPSSTLYLPVTDTNFFSPPIEPVCRSGSAFYAGKYKYRFGGKTFPITDGMQEITRDRPDSQTPQQIRDLFRSIEFFYSYEDTALALEAILCGCPVVFLPNEHFTKPLGGNELKHFGIAWGATPEQMYHAQQTVAAARVEHLRRVDEVINQIQRFVSDTQAIASCKSYKTPFGQGELRSPGLMLKIISTVSLLRDVTVERGMKNTIATVIKRILAKRLSF